MISTLGGKLSIRTPEDGTIPEATRILLLTFVAVCLGALVGLERQVAQEESEGEKDFPGVRTFAFTALIGALAVLIARGLGEWLAVSMFIASATFLVLRYRWDATTRGDPGYTTEIASLCTFAVGALAQLGELMVATVVTIVMVALLRSKKVLHQAAELLSARDMEMLIRFLVITGIVLPLLPEDPVATLVEVSKLFEVLGPRDVWRMVVLISSVSFFGYALMRLGAGRSSQLIAGMLGGLVSSTATAVAYARAARGVAASRDYETLVVASVAVSFVRTALLLLFVSPGLLGSLYVPLGAMFGVGMALALTRHAPAGQAVEAHEYGNPLGLRTAVSFAGFYALVLLLVEAAREHFAEAGIYLLSALAALPGASAATLSLARLHADAGLSADVAYQAITVVAITTTIAKVGLLIALGDRSFVRRVAPSLAAIAAVGALALWRM
ncbi:MAG: DUF4010 domain-containing protein [Myxococcota bacterium]|nr:DUF4010 domain-containing protein [Myxococcota bacterium]